MTTLDLIRFDWDDLPKPTNPADVSLRGYRFGDAQAWNQLLASAYQTSAHRPDFASDIYHDSAFRHERVRIAEANGRLLASALAWYAPETMPEHGLLHWPAITAGQTAELRQTIILDALAQMQREGRTGAWARCEHHRSADLLCLLDLGFQPLITADLQRHAWLITLNELHQDGLIERYNAAINGPLWQPQLLLHPDHVHYPSRTKTLRRWHQHRPLAESTGNVSDARADEHLYKPSRLGSASCDLRRVTACEDQPFELVYRCGEQELDPGTTVLFWMAGQGSLGDTPQNVDPDHFGYVEMDGPEGLDIKAILAPYRVISKTAGEDPPGGIHAGDYLVGPITLGFRITGGCMRQGDQLRIRVGHSKGFRWKPVSGRKEFKVIIDPGRDEPRMRLPQPLRIDILPLAADHLEIHLPGSASAGKAIEASISLRDRHDNRVEWDGPVQLSIGAAQHTAYLSRGIGRCACGSMGKTALQARASCDVVPDEALSNICVPTASFGEGLNLYFGDMHTHDFNSTAEGYTADCFRHARDDKRLDFQSLPVQVHRWIDDEKWLLLKHMHEYFLEEGRFVTFLAFEWQHSHYGDKVIHYLGGDQPYLPIDDPRYGDPAGLYEAVRRSDAFIISHHVGYGLDLHVPGCRWETMDNEVDRICEIWSMHGSSEGFDQQDRPLVPPFRADGAYGGLRQGRRFGICAGSDTHTARPTGSAQDCRPYWGGTCAVWAEGLTRQDLFQAFMQRRTYAITGARIALRFSLNQALMGDEVALCTERRLRIQVAAPSPIATVQILRDTKLIHEISRPDQNSDLRWTDAMESPSFYHCRIVLEDGNLAVSSPIWVG